MRVLEKTVTAAASLSSILLFGLAILITVDVIIRAVTGRPLVGVFEAAEVTLILITFLAVPLVQLSHRQLRVDIISSLFTGRGHNFFELLDGAFGLLFFGSLFYAASKAWVAAWRGGYVGRGMVEIPNTIPLAFLTVGALLVGMVFVVSVWVNGQALFLPRAGQPSSDRGTADRE